MICRMAKISPLCESDHCNFDSEIGRLSRMAKEPKQASAPKIEFDALTDKLVPDPATIPDSVALTGFVGRSAEDGKYPALRRREFSKLLRNLDLRIFSTISNCPRRNLHWEDRSFTLRAALLCGGCRFQRKSKPGFYRARCRMSARGPAGASSLPGANRAFLFRTPVTVLCRRSDAPTSCEDVCVRSYRRVLTAATAASTA